MSERRETGYPQGSYVPARPPRSEPRYAHADVDPGSFEVIRNRLWNVNEENAATLYATSGSPVVVHGRDYNVALLTGDGEYVYFGPYIQIKAGVMDLAVAYVLEHHADFLGLHRGDVVVLNDPWIASGHVNDVVSLAPVLHDDEIVFWVVNSLHHIDVGGSAAGGRDVVAENAFQEGTRLPPVKVVDRGEVRGDVVKLFERQSRLPAYAGLDLRAQIAGNLAAARRLEELIDADGLDAVGHVAEQVIDASATAFARRLHALPDGTWRERVFVDGAREGDTRLYRVATRLTKRGDRLTFADDRSDPQQPGPINATWAAWRAGIISALMAQVGFDAPFATGGLLRHVDFEYRPGTLLNATFPAPTNRATGFGLNYSAINAQRLVARLLACAPGQRASISAGSGSEPLITVGMTGRRRGGSPYLRVFVDPIGCGSGAGFGFDGDDTGGSTINLGAVVPNVEENEATGGCLYLYRRQELDTGGAGTWNGGAAIGLGFVSYGVETADLHVSGCGAAFPPAMGLFGGLPSGSRSSTVIRDTDLWERVRAGEWPGGTATLAGTTSVLPGKLQATALGADDVVVLVAGGGAGVGYPLQRPPEDVARLEGRAQCSTETAERVYGVVFTEAGDPDARATAAARERIRRERLPSEPAFELPDRKDPPARDNGAVGPHPAVDLVGSEYRCAWCDTPLGASTGWYTSVAAHNVRAVESLGPAYHPVGDAADETVVVHEYSCPGCATLLEVDLAPVGDALPECEVHWDAPGLP